MTLEEIIEGVKRVEQSKDDAESAHSIEDALYLRFVAHIADHGPPDLAEMAKELFKTQGIKFDRYCA